MPPKKNTPNKRTGTAQWRKYGPYAAQLFRDIYFGKYKRDEEGKFAGKVIFEDPTRQYHKLNKTSFYRHIEEIADRVEAYKANGTGLGTAEFKRLVNLKNVPPPEDRGIDWDKDEEEEEEEEEEEGKEDEEDRALSSDSDDSTYFGANEEDEDLDSDFVNEAEDEEAENTEEKEEEKKMPPKKKKTASAKKKKAPEIAEVEEAMKKVKLAAKDDGDLKYMFKLADGRICCVFQLTSGFEGNFEFNPGRKKTKVMLKRVMPRWSYSARRVFRRKGLDPNNANVVELQTMMDAQIKDDIRAMGIVDPETYRGPVTRSREVFDVSELGVEEVLPYFLDELGTQTTDINADTGSGAEWVFFWLRDKNSVLETHPVGRIVRNNRRDRESMEGEDEDEVSRARARMSEESGDARYMDAHSVPE